VNHHKFILKTRRDESSQIHLKDKTGKLRGKKERKTSLKSNKQKGYQNGDRVAHKNNK